MIYDMARSASHWPPVPTSRPSRRCSARQHRAHRGHLHQRPPRTARRFSRGHRPTRPRPRRPHTRPTPPQPRPRRPAKVRDSSTNPTAGTQAGQAIPPPTQPEEERPTHAPPTSHKDQGHIAMKLYGLVTRVHPRGLEPRGSRRREEVGPTGLEPARSRWRKAAPPTGFHADAYRILWESPPKIRTLSQMPSWVGRLGSVGWVDPPVGPVGSSRPATSPGP
jgi:hypothetical protein